MIHFDVLAQTGDRWQFVISESSERGTRMMRPDGRWSEWVPEMEWAGGFPEATLSLSPGSLGMRHREITGRIAEACSFAVSDSSAATEARVLREVLAKEQGRVDQMLTRYLG